MSHLLFRMAVTAQFIMTTVGYTIGMNIQDTFEESIRSSDLPDVAIDVTETSIDALLKNDLLKQIPIVKLFIGVTETGINIRDKLFLKKILSFLANIDDVAPDERRKVIDTIDTLRKYRLSVGEKLLYILDSCADHESAERIARLFRAVLTKLISYGEYLEAASILVRISTRELEIFLGAYKQTSVDDDAKELVHTGLVFVESEDVSVDLQKMTQDDWDDPEEHYETKVNGGGTFLLPTDAGDTIYTVFGKDNEEPKVLP